MGNWSRSRRENGSQTEVRRQWSFLSGSIQTRCESRMKKLLSLQLSEYRHVSHWTKDVHYIERLRRELVTSPKESHLVSINDDSCRHCWTSLCKISCYYVVDVTFRFMPFVNNQHCVRFHDGIGFIKTVSSLKWIWMSVKPVMQSHLPVHTLKTLHVQVLFSRY